MDKTSGTCKEHAQVIAGIRQKVLGTVSKGFGVLHTVIHMLWHLSHSRFRHCQHWGILYETNTACACDAWKDLFATCVRSLLHVRFVWFTRASLIVFSFLSFMAYSDPIISIGPAVQLDFLITDTYTAHISSTEVGGTRNWSRPQVQSMHATTQPCPGLV